MSRSTRLLLLAMVLFVVLAVREWWTTEDAWISFRYALYEARGLGLRFNPNTDPPVEGYSNFLWVQLAVLFHLVGLAPQTWVDVVSMGLGVTTLWAVWRTAIDHLGASERAAAHAVVVLAATTCFTRWGTGGLEVMAQTACMFGAPVALAFGSGRRSLGVAVLAGASLVLLRSTEGAYWLPVHALAAVALRHREGTPYKARVAVYALAVGAVALGYQVFRVAYFDAWISNTTLAKVGVSDQAHVIGAKYVGAFLLVNLPLIAVSLLGYIHGLRTQLARALWFGALGCGQLAFCVVVGGDYIAWFRFAAPCLPWVAVGVALAFDALERLPSYGRLLPAASGVLALLAWLPEVDVFAVPTSVIARLDMASGPNPTGAPVTFRGGQFRVDLPRRKLKDEAQMYRLLLKPGESIVTGAIGAIGYENPQTILYDMCGIVNREVAATRPDPILDMRPGHQKCVRQSWFYDAKPDILAIDVVEPEDPKSLDEVEQAAKVLMRKDPEKRYFPEVVAVSRPKTGDTTYGLVLRRAESPAQRERQVTRFQEELARFQGLLDKGQSPGRPLESFR